MFRAANSGAFVSDISASNWRSSISDVAVFAKRQHANEARLAMSSNLLRELLM
jgi:hypothetical protein